MGKSEVVTDDRQEQRAANADAQGGHTPGSSSGCSGANRCNQQGCNGGRVATGRGKAPNPMVHGPWSMVYGHAGRPMPSLSPSHCPMMAFVATYFSKAVLVCSDPAFVLR